MPVPLIVARKHPPAKPMPACRLHDPEIWFPVGEVGQGAIMQAELAKAICHGCPLKDACLDWALRTGVPYGIWGGKTERERRAIQRHEGGPRAGTEGRHELVKALASA